MSSPHSNHSDSNYPEDKVTHYPKHKALHKRSKAKSGSREEAHLSMVKGVGKHASKYHDKKGCSVCSKYH